MKKTVLAIALAAAFAMPAFAQSTKPTVKGTLPTAAQCKSGYKQGMKWTKQQFTVACVKINAAAQGR